MVKTLARFSFSSKSGAKIKVEINPTEMVLTLIFKAYE
jgi:hypothetical protein